MGKKNICFIDFETTGIDLINDYPIQLGASLMDIETGTELANFSSYIQPGKTWDETDRAFKVHGITYETAMSGLSQWDCLNRFFDTMGTDYSFGAWNACFDVQFFRRMCYENGFENQMHKIYYRHFDLQSYVRGLNETHQLDGIESLDDLRRFFDIKRRSDHDAYEDAYITRRCCVELFDYIYDAFERTA